MHFRLWTGLASLLALIAIGPMSQSSAGQLPTLATGSIVIQVQKKGCVGDRGARYRDYGDCVRRRSPSMGAGAANYCGRICR